MKYKITDRNTVKGIPETKHPNAWDYELGVNNIYFRRDLAAYNESEKNTPEYPLPEDFIKPEWWPEELEEFVQFKLQNREFNIYSEKGTKVTTNETLMGWGYYSDKEKAHKYLKPGGIYTVEKTKVYDWSSDVYLEEFPNVSFNSVHFISVEIVAIPLPEPAANKPPLGLMPEWRHKELRVQEIDEAVERYVEENKQIPQEWIDDNIISPLQQQLSDLQFRKDLEGIGFEKIMRSYFHGFSDEQWEEKRQQFPYNAIPFICEASRSHLEQQLSDYKEVIEDNKRLCREIDVIMFGKDAAKQPSLCDIVKSVESLVEKLSEKDKEINIQKDYYEIKIESLVRQLNGKAVDKPDFFEGILNQPYHLRPKYVSRKEITDNRKRFIR